MPTIARTLCAIVSTTILSAEWMGPATKPRSRAARAAPVLGKRRAEAGCAHCVRYSCRARRFLSSTSTSLSCSAVPSSFTRTPLSVQKTHKRRKMMASSDTESSGPMEPLANYLAKGQRTYQQWLDRVTPFVLYRWLGTAGLLSLFMLRIVFAEGVSLQGISWPWIAKLTSSGALLSLHYHSGILVRPASFHTIRDDTDNP